MPESEPLKPDHESKSQRKRDMLALQKIGESLLKLSADQLSTLDLPENLLTAIKDSKLLTSNEAKRRHLQYIGKLMRHIDPEPVKQALKRMQVAHVKVTEEFHEAESWRDKLVERGDEELNQFLNEHPAIDRQQLRQLVRKAQHDRKHNKNTGAETALFRHLRSIL